jgi:hypothetical protein
MAEGNKGRRGGAQPGGGAPKGNTNYTKGRPMIDALRRLVLQGVSGKFNGNGEVLRECALTLLEQARAGEAWAQHLLWDRLDGKVPQPLAVSDPDGAPLFSTIQRVIIDQIATEQPALPDDRITH